jgi:hypothetical protein
MFLWKKAEVHNIQKDIAEFGSTFKNETHQNIESIVFFLFSFTGFSMSSVFLVDFSSDVSIHPRMSVFGLVILVGTLLSIINFISVLNDCHILSIFRWDSFLKVDPNSAISFCML